MKLIPLLLIIVFLFTQDVNDLQQKEFSGDIQHLLTIDGSNKYNSFRAQDLCVNQSGNIYITDQLEDCIKIFDQNGKFLKKVGKNGNKPGEFNTIGEIAISENYIAISDYKSSRLQIFSKDFMHIHTLYAQGVIFDLAFDSDECLWVAAYTNKKAKTLFKYAKESNTVTQVIPLKYSSGDEFKDIFSLAISKDGYVIVAYRILNRIEIWDKSGKFVREFQIPGLKSEADYKRVTTGLFSSTKVPEGIIIGFCSVNDYGNIFLIGGNYSENPLQDLYIMNIKGEFVSKIKMPDKMWKIAAQGKRNIILISGRDLNRIKNYILK